MPSIVAFQLKQIFNRNPIFFSKWHVLQTTSDVENVSFAAFVISQPINNVIPNGHDKLNRLMIAQTPLLYSAKKY